MSNFEMNLDLGNVAMATGADVAEALRNVAQRIERGEVGSAVLDANGNTVGYWSLDEDDYEDDGQGDDAWADAQTFESAYGPEDY